MYIPSAFRVDDTDKLLSFMRQHRFATLISSDHGVPYASHLPVLCKSTDGQSQKLVAHMARANPQWTHFENGTEVLVIFAGPHAYISPTWYTTELSVPTWNYASVHVYGTPQVIEEHDRVRDLLQETVAIYESQREQPWSDRLPDDFRDKLTQAIVAFEIQVTRIEGKFKLGQNRSAEDLAGVYNGLAKSVNPQELALAELMVTENIVREETS